MGLRWNFIRQGASLLFITELSSRNTPSWWAHLNLRKSITDWHVNSPRPPFGLPSPARLHRCLRCMCWHSVHTSCTPSISPDLHLGGGAGKWKIWKGLKIEGRCELTGWEWWKWTWSNEWKWETWDWAVDLCIVGLCFWSPCWLQTVSFVPPITSKERTQGINLFMVSNNRKKDCSVSLFIWTRDLCFKTILKHW